MKTKGPREDFRVVVTPRDMGDFGSISAGRMFYERTPAGQKRWERDMEERCRDMAAEIKRHVDSVFRAEVEFDQRDVCEHCGSRWTEESADYNGGCCADDQNAYDTTLTSQESP